MDIIHAITVGTDGHKHLSEKSVSPSSLRPIIQGDNALLWLRYHGAAHGFEQDPEEGSLLQYISRQGQAFEAKWLSELAPEAVAVSDNDYSVREYKSFLKTLELMARRTPVITKASVWNAKFGVHGTCDMIALSSWLRQHFPTLVPYLGDENNDIYHVLDMKNQRGLYMPHGALNLKLASTQIGIYTRALGEIQGQSASHAFLVTPDHIFSPLPVPVEGGIGDPLPREVTAMISLHNRIKSKGHSYKPWLDQIVAPNFLNKKDAPWTTAKKLILTDYLSHRPLELLPGVGRDQAESLRAAGFATTEDLLSKNARYFDFTTVKGFGKSRARNLRAVLDANSEESSVSPVVPSKALPPICPVELYVDYEFITPIRVDIEKTWPKLRGTELLFMIGVGWEEDGDWRFRKFCAEDDTPAAEKKMLDEYIAFLRNKGVIFGSTLEATVCSEGTAAMYHYSPAELGASRRAADRTGLDVLRDLPWVDLIKPFKSGPIVLPGQFDFSIKSVSKALSKFSPEHATSYPKNLSAGADAMALAINAYDRGGDVVGSEEFATISAYLEIDCENLYQILRWLRSQVKDDSNTPSSSRGIRGERAASCSTFRWYKRSLEVPAATPAVKPSNNSLSVNASHVEH